MSESTSGLRWKRKGGRAVAEAAGMTFRVEDDGACAWRNPSGLWEHGKGDSAEDAKRRCEAIAAGHGGVVALEAQQLAARRAAAAELAAMDPVDRRWADALASMLVDVARGHVVRDMILAQLPGGATRQLFEGLTADAAFMARVAESKPEVARDWIKRSVVRSLAASKAERARAEIGSDLAAVMKHRS
jgi:hypothetical protein